MFVTVTMSLLEGMGAAVELFLLTLLFALRPYLKQERQEKVERALQLARLYHIGKKVLSEWEG